MPTVFSLEIKHAYNLPLKSSVEKKLTFVLYVFVHIVNMEEHFASHLQVVGSAGET